MSIENIDVLLAVRRLTREFHVVPREIGECGCGSHLTRSNALMCCACPKCWWWQSDESVARHGAWWIKPKYARLFP